MIKKRIQLRPWQKFIGKNVPGVWTIFSATFLKTAKDNKINNFHMLLEFLSSAWWKKTAVGKSKLEFYY